VTDTYVLRPAVAPSFETKGLRGFQFAPLRHQALDVHLVEVKTGHDTFVISKKITRLYYVLEGRGSFTIAAQKYDVEPGMLVEVPPALEYSYSGTMKLLLIGSPRWFQGNEQVTRDNPDVLNRFSSRIRRLLSKLR
jgi:mannose-6-phosphate isomerase-like protein (cupin superfamily)